MASLLACALAPKTVHFTLPKSVFGMFWVGFLALFALMLWAVSQAKRKRRAALEQFGMEMGFMFSEKPDDALAARLAEIHFNIARLESAARYSNVLLGSAAGGEAIIADRSVGRGESNSTATIFAFSFKTPLPQFQIYPENALWHLVEKLGYSDIDIDGAPNFSRRFFLHGADEAAVRELFKPEVTQVFEQLESKNSLYINASGSWLVLTRQGRPIRPEQYREILQQAEPIVTAFRRAQSASAPRYLST
jgi:hypothetical protein